MGQMTPVRDRRPVRITLPTLRVGKAPNGLVKPHKVKAGDIVHLRVEFRTEQAFELGPEESYRSRKFYSVVPRQVGQMMEEAGVSAGKQILTGWDHHDLAEEEAPMATVRIDRGSGGKISVLVPEAMALEWTKTALRFKRLFEDYQTIMKGAAR